MLRETGRAIAVREISRANSYRSSYRIKQRGLGQREATIRMPFDAFRSKHHDHCRRIGNGCTPGRIEAWLREAHRQWQVAGESGDGRTEIQAVKEAATRALPAAWLALARVFPSKETELRERITGLRENGIGWDDAPGPGFRRLLDHWREPIGRIPPVSRLIVGLHLVLDWPAIAELLNGALDGVAGGLLSESATMDEGGQALDSFWDWIRFNVLGASSTYLTANDPAADWCAWLGGALPPAARYSPKEGGASWGQLSEFRAHGFSRERGEPGASSVSSSDRFKRLREMWRDHKGLLEDPGFERLWELR
jgi:hypothetical protein